MTHIGTVLLVYAAALMLLFPSGVVSKITDARPGDGDGTVTLTGEQRRWHPITLTLDGPAAEETAGTFRDRRFAVTFVHDSTGARRTVPGFFAADGSAAQSSAASGTKWRVIFVPGKTGRWTYTTHFREGRDVAVRLDSTAGSANAYDGIRGSFSVEETDKQPPDGRARGFLRYDGTPYYRYADGTRYIGVGPDSPENFLEYTGFDGTVNLDGTDYVRDWDAHLQYWQDDDPTWKGGAGERARGRGLIGAINYIASKGMNQQYFITMNIEGDGRATYPYTPAAASTGRYDVFDVSKLEQWRIVLAHMMQQGITAHLLLQETENELLFENGSASDMQNVYRRLYYRELIARLGWHPAVIWNLGEEQNHTTNAPHGNAASSAQREAWAQYIRRIDPYIHPITIHNWQMTQSEYVALYRGFLGVEAFNGPSLQWDEGIDAEIRRWHEESRASGRPWVVMMTEYNGGGQGPSDSNRARWRKAALWESLMNGAGAVELYFGNAGGVDLTTEDFHPWSRAFDYMRFARRFFDRLPVLEMTLDNEVAREAGAAYARASSDSLYVIYWENATRVGSLDLSESEGTYDAEWFNPRTGGFLPAGTRGGGSVVDLPDPPEDGDQDWALIVRRREG